MWDSIVGADIARGIKNKQYSCLWGREVLNYTLERHSQICVCGLFLGCDWVPSHAGHL